MTNRSYAALAEIGDETVRAAHGDKPAIPSVHESLAKKREK